MVDYGTRTSLDSVMRKPIERFIFIGGIVDRYSGTILAAATKRVADLGWDGDVVRNYKQLPAIEPSDRAYLHLRDGRWLTGDVTLGHASFSDFDCIAVCSAKEHCKPSEVVAAVERAFGKILHLEVVLAPTPTQANRFLYSIPSGHPLYQLGRNVDSFFSDDLDHFCRANFVSQNQRHLVLPAKRWIEQVGSFMGPSFDQFGIGDGDKIIVVSHSDPRPEDALVELLSSAPWGRDEPPMSRDAESRSHREPPPSPQPTASRSVHSTTVHSRPEVAIAGPTAPASSAPEVFLGAATPRQVAPGREFVVQFAAYLQQYRGHVESVLRQETPGSELLLDSDTCVWKSGTTVSVRLSGNSLQIQRETQSFVWNGKWRILRFDVLVPSDIAPGRLNLKFDIVVEGIIVANLRPEIEIVGAELKPPTAADAVSTQLRAPRSAFASYASADRSEVLGRVRSLQIFTGMDVFLDCLSIRPGEEWKKVIQDQIHNRELFWLFWSQHARSSPWVEWEWKQALQEHKAIQPHPLEPVEVAPPPRELEQLQFGAAFELYLQAQRNRLSRRTWQLAIALWQVVVRMARSPRLRLAYLAGLITAVVVAAGLLLNTWLNGRNESPSGIPVRSRDHEGLRISDPDAIRAMPDVATVTVRAADTPTHRVIHILDWHYIPEKRFRIDTPDGDYDAFLDDVEALQAQQRAVIKAIGVKTVFLEGLTAKSEDHYRKRIATLKKYKPVKSNEPVDEFIRQLRREDTLQLGAPGAMLIAGELDAVLLVDYADLPTAADPVKGEKLEFDEAANKAREAGIAKLLLAHKEAVVILGGEHDVTEFLPTTVEYVRVTLKVYKAVAE